MVGVASVLDVVEMVDTVRVVGVAGVVTFGTVLVQFASLYLSTADHEMELLFPSELTL